MKCRLYLPEAKLCLLLQTKLETHVWFTVKQTEFCFQFYENFYVLSFNAKFSKGDEEEKFLAQSVMDLKNRRNKNKGHKRKGANFSHGGKRGRR